MATRPHAEASGAIIDHFGPHSHLSKQAFYKSAVTLTCHNFPFEKQLSVLPLFSRRDGDIHTAKAKATKSYTVHPWPCAVTRTELGSSQPQVNLL